MTLLCAIFWVWWLTYRLPVLLTPSKSPRKSPSKSEEPDWLDRQLAKPQHNRRPLIEKFLGCCLVIFSIIILASVLKLL